MSEYQFSTVNSHPKMEKRMPVSLIQICYAFALMLFVVPDTFGFPLTTEDTGTLAQGRTKIELNGERGEDQMNGVKEVSINNEVVIVHGLRANLNGFLNLPYSDISAQEEDGSSSHNRGFADVKIGFKWRYLEQENFSLVLKGIVATPTGDSSKNLGNGQSSYGISAIASYEANPIEFHLNLGCTYLPNTRNQRELIENISAAVAINMNREWKLMADIGIAVDKSKTSNEAPAFVGAGLKFKINSDLSVEMGVKHGLTAEETDNTILIGINQILN